MFGEKEIIGQTIVKIDSKKRIVLPKFTNAELNDELLVLDMTKYNADYISIHTENSLNKCIDRLNEKYKHANVDEKNKLRHIKRIIYTSVRDGIICDSNRRISLSGVSEEINEFICIGCKDHIKLKIK